MNFSFAKLWGKLKINKMSEDLRNFENFIEEKKISSVLNPVPLTTYAMSFYRSQNLLGWSKYSVQDQKIIYILWQSQKSFLKRRTKCRQIFGLAQKI